MKIRLLFSFSDWKADAKLIGVNLLPPVIAFALAVFVAYCGLFCGNIGEYEIFSLLQIALPIGASWLCVFSQKHIWESEGGDMYFSFSVGRLYVGPARAFRISAIYSIVFLAAVYYALCRFFAPSGALRACAILLAQSIFLSAWGFFAMTVMKNCLLSMLAVTAYCALYLFADANAPEVFNIYLPEEQIRGLFGLKSAIKPLIMAAVLWSASAVVYTKRE